MNKLFFFLAFFFFALSVSAQTIFQKNYLAKEAYTDFDAMIQTKDGGFALAGFTEANDVLGNILVVKTNKEGEVEWAKVIGTDSTDVASGIREASNGDLVIGGYTYGSDNDKQYDDVLLFRLKANGALLWAYSYGGADFDEVSDLAIMANENIVLSGSTSSYGTTVKAAYAIVTDENGVLINAHVVEQNVLNEFQTVTAMPNGGALLAGHTPKFGAGGTSYDPIVSKLNKEGALEWSRRYKIPGAQLIFGAMALPNGGFVLTGVTPNPTATQEADIFVLKTNPNGTPIWIKSYGTATYERAYTVSLARDSSYLVSGYRRSSADPLSPRTGFVFDIDATTGKSLWAKTYGDTLNKSSFSSIVALDNGIAMAGYTLVAGGTIGAGYLVRSDLKGNAAGCSENPLVWTSNSTLTSSDSLNVQASNDGVQLPIALKVVDYTSDLAANAFCSKVDVAETELSNLAFSIHPNPSSPNGSFALTTQDGSMLNSVEIMDLQGKIWFQTQNYNEKMPLQAALPQGIYLVKIKQASRVGYQKLIVVGE